MIADNSVLPQETVVPAFSMYSGSPSKSPHHISSNLNHLIIQTAYKNPALIRHAFLEKLVFLCVKDD